MTNILIASDSFKGSATSLEVADYLSKGMRQVDEKLEIKKAPVADGGEGTVRSIVESQNGKFFQTRVLGPCAKEITAEWGMINNTTAIIEIAQAVGITLEQNSMDPMNNTSYGVGQLIEAAAEHGAKTIYIGLGGSATNDGGVGMAQALGADFKDKYGNEIRFGGGYLDTIGSINLDKLQQKVKDLTIIGLSDVSNPLLGSKGATYIFGPQKGASKDQLKKLDANLAHLNTAVKRVVKNDLSGSFGAGAAGGIGYGILAFLNGTLESGIEGVIDLTELEDKIVAADLIVTGEGQMDGQSIMGKAPIGIARLAKKHNKPVVAVTGSIGTNIDAVYKEGIDLVLSSTTSPMTVESAIKDAPKLLEQAGSTIVRAFYISERR